MVPNVKGVWYYISIFACPVCGRCDEYRERRPAPKPEDWRDRISYSEVWDYCNAL